MKLQCLLIIRLLVCGVPLITNMYSKSALWYVCIQLPYVNMYQLLSSPAPCIILYIYYYDCGIIHLYTFVHEWCDQWFSEWLYWMWVGRIVYSMIGGVGLLTFSQVLTQYWFSPQPVGAEVGGACLGYVVALVSLVPAGTINQRLMVLSMWGLVLFPGCSHLQYLIWSRSQTLLKSGRGTGVLSDISCHMGWHHNL